MFLSFRSQNYTMYKNSKIIDPLIRLLLLTSLITFSTIQILSKIQISIIPHLQICNIIRNLIQYPPPSPPYYTLKPKE